MKGRNLFQQESTWCRLTHSTEIPGGIQTNKLGRPGEGRMSNRGLNIIGAAGEIWRAACQELNSLLSFLFSHICFSSSSTSPRCLSSRRLVHTTCFLLHISAGGGVRGSSGVVGGGDLPWALFDQPHRKRCSHYMASQKFAFWDTLLSWCSH